MSPVTHRATPTVEYRFDEDDGTAEVPAPRACAQHAGQLVAGRYRLVNRLGAGSSAYVWTAHDDRLDRDVAIKILRETGEPGGAEEQRMRREARVLAHLQHPGITAVFDLIDDADAPEGCALALVTELLTGEDLAARLRRGPLGLDETLDLGAQVAEALEAAHRAGVVHRDVKPANVMLTASGVKLLDFGIARTEADAESELTGPAAIGTPACMAPEQWLGRPPEPATDVYALGCLLYWCLAGHAPFAQRVLPALAVAHIEAEPPDLPDRGQDPRIDELYRACLAKDPLHRPTAASLVAELHPTASAGATARRCSTVPPRRARWRTSARSRAVVILTGGSLCLAGSIAVPLAVSSPAAQPVSKTAPLTPSASASRAAGASARPAPRPTPSTPTGQSPPPKGPTDQAPVAGHGNHRHPPHQGGR